MNSVSETQPSEHIHYSIEFTYDSDCDCTVKIHFFATEKYNATSGKLSYTCGCERFSETPADRTCWCVDGDGLKRGSGQTFKLGTDHSIDPSR